MRNIIEIANGVPRHPNYRMKEPVNLTIAEGEQIAVVGPNGAGKSRLIDIITGRWPLLLNEVKYSFGEGSSSLSSENIKLITFQDSYGDSDGSYFYQQRWNSQDMETTPLVVDLLPTIQDESLKEKLYRLFDIEEIEQKNIILKPKLFNYKKKKQS